MSTEDSRAGDPSFALIDVDRWPRRDHFEHYRERVPCTVAITVEIDVSAFVTAARRAGRRQYLAQIWAVARVVDRHEELRLALDEAGRPGVWSVRHPAFTVFDAERETFACLWTEYDDDFGRFHDRAASVIEAHRGATTMFPTGPPPPNAFDVSSLPWTSFTGFALGLGDGGDHLAPIITFGRYVERDGATFLPVAVQIHHAAADGFHVSRMLEELAGLVRSPSWLVPGDVVDGR